jgi:hypothetical protein
MPSLLPKMTEDDRRMLLAGWTPGSYLLRKTLVIRGWARNKGAANPHAGYPDIELTDAGRAALASGEGK